MLIHGVIGKSWGVKSVIRFRRVCVWGSPCEVIVVRNGDNLLPPTVFQPNSVQHGRARQEKSNRS